MVRLTWAILVGPVSALKPVSKPSESELPFGISFEVVHMKEKLFIPRSDRFDAVRHRKQRRTRSQRSGDSGAHPIPDNEPRPEDGEQAGLSGWILRALGRNPRPERVSRAIAVGQAWLATGCFGGLLQLAIQSTAEGEPLVVLKMDPSTHMITVAAPLLHADQMVFSSKKKDQCPHKLAVDRLLRLITGGRTLEEAIEEAKEVLQADSQDDTE